MISASKAGLVHACGYSFREGTPCVDERGRSAINGDRFHKAIASYIQTGVRPIETGRPLKWLEDRLDHAIAHVDARQAGEGGGWKVEMAFAFDPRTGQSRILGYDLSRKYKEAGLLPHEIAGSADLVWMSGETVVVVDHKTGRAISDSVWPQMQWLSVMAARALGAWGARAVIWHATDYGIIEYEQTYDDVALARIADGMRADIEAVPDSWPTPGLHCDALYCNARAACDLYTITRRETAA